MTKKIYLETLKSVLGRSISHYSYYFDPLIQRLLHDSFTLVKKDVSAGKHHTIQDLLFRYYVPWWYVLLTCFFYAWDSVVRLWIITHNTDQLLTLRIGGHLPAMSHLSNSIKPIKSGSLNCLLFILNTQLTHLSLVWRRSLASKMHMTSDVSSWFHWADCVICFHTFIRIYEIFGILQHHHFLWLAKPWSPFYIIPWDGIGFCISLLVCW